jgi:regulator of protease activity HflC (stomatin/prohibitin superfamily)
MTFVIIVAVIVFIVTAKALRVAPADHADVIERLGRYHFTAQPGLYVILPFIDRVARRYSLAEQKLEVAVPVIFHDNETATIAATVRYRVFDAQRVAYNVPDIAATVQQIVTTAVRGEASQRTRDAMREETRAAGQAATRKADAIAEPMGLKIVECLF